MMPRLGGKYDIEILAEPQKFDSTYKEKKVKKLRIMSTSAVMASPLVLASGLRATVEVPVKTQLQD